MTEDTNPTPHPWERQPDETDKAFEAFGIYRDLGPARSVAAVCRELGKSRGTVERWSLGNGWSKRVSAWDDEADRLSRERDLLERAEARRKMLDAHAKGGQTLHEIGALVLAKYDVKDPAKGDEAKRQIAEMTATDAARLMEAGAKLERLARGETTERTETRDAVRWVETFVDLSLSYIPPSAHDAFLAEVEAKLAGMTA